MFILCLGQTRLDSSKAAERVVDVAVLRVPAPLAPGQEEHRHGAGVGLLDGPDNLAHIRKDVVTHLNGDE